jgi:hypothetical protein
MCFPPLRWQTYDIDFTPARFDDKGKKIAKARITVRQNGVVVQNNVELDNKTGAGKPEGPDPLPMVLQDHGNPVQFRNIWMVNREPSSTTNDSVIESNIDAFSDCCPPDPSFGRMRWRRHW